MIGYHIETLIKRDDFGRPTRQLGWSTRSPRGAAQWTCDFRELPALDRSLSLRELFGQCLWGAMGAHGICAKCCNCYSRKYHITGDVRWQLWVPHSVSATPHSSFLCLQHNGVEDVVPDICSSATPPRMHSSSACQLISSSACQLI